MGDRTTLERNMKHPMNKEFLLKELVRVGSMSLQPEYEALGDELVNEGLAQKMGVPQLMVYSPTQKGIQLC